MNWMEIVSALALVMFIIVLLPVTRNMMKNSAKGTSADWMGFVIRVVVIFLFVMLLVKLV
jgi:succinate dehydrogenase hydrophobic anchor subunit